eukprot:INCI14405.1.p1 GENE.INCI14405.1~~INCI14405.1.p1  ORF type:complete len:421 (-),score=98.05 INCI14405.1:1418-2545(-)
MAEVHGPASSKLSVAAQQNPEGAAPSKAEADQSKKPPATKLVAFKKKNRKKGKGGRRRPGRVTQSMAADADAKGSTAEEGSRSAGNGEDAEDGENPSIVLVNLKRKKTVNTFGTASVKKSRSAANGPVLGGGLDLTVVSDRSTTAVQNSGGATAIAEFDTAADCDERAIRERNIELNESGVADDATTYRGAAGYKNYIRKDKEQLAANKFTGTQGPIRPSVFFRPSFRMDYQPDVCKDYKETGFCGFGDTCKFLHDRGDYKQGWQIEQDFQAQEKRRLAKLNGEEVEDDPDFSGKKKNEDELPFACLICRERFTEPVETKCGHFFCEECALDRYRKDSTCFACGKETRGVFNVAKKIMERMEAADAAEAAKQQAR